MNLPQAHVKILSACIKAVLVVGLVGHPLTGTASAQGKVDNSGNPDILAAVKAVADTVTNLQTTLDGLQLKVEALGASTDGTPSWNLTLPAATRFVVLPNFSNAAVLDRETGLVWERTPNESSAIWGDKVLDCAFSGLGGRQGWRLPTAPELLSLRDPATTVGQLLPVGHPFVAVPNATAFPGTYFWTSTHTNVSLGPFPANSYVVVSFDPGAQEFVRARVPTAANTWAWCVRGPSNHSID